MDNKTFKHRNSKCYSVINLKNLLFAGKYYWIIIGKYDGFSDDDV